MKESFRIGIAGLGTVGAGVVDLLQRNGALIAARAGVPIEIAAVCSRDRRKTRGVDISSYEWVEAPGALLGAGGLDAVIELIGGQDGVAKDLCERALSRGVSVVTANKAMLAHYGYDLAVLAEKNGAALMYEAAVAGGIPIVKSLREGLAGNKISAVYGILNGTCNYILTVMRETGRDFADVLAEAQEKGYAEADSALDIDGLDAAHKLCLLAALAFGVRPGFDSISIQGIGRVAAADIASAHDLGYRIRLLGIARREGEKIIQTVAPCLVPEDSMVGAVDGVFNAVCVESDSAGKIIEIGRGAGAEPTASAVVSDIIDLARGCGHKIPAFGLPASGLAQAVQAKNDLLPGRFYIRLSVIDRPGVLADVTAVMRDCDVSIESLLQRGRDPDRPVSIVMTTHQAAQGDVRMAVSRLAGLKAACESPCLMRIEAL